MSSKQYTGRKREVQYHFYNQVQTKSSVTALAGNNLDLHINDILPVLSSWSKAYIYDLSTDVIANFKYLELKHPNVQLIHDNIVNCKITRFMDIDLMRTLDSIKGIVYYLFQEQYMKCKPYQDDKWNTFMFTHCLRNNKTDVNTFIKDVLLKDKDIQVYVESINYKDGAPMCTTQIQWKRGI